MKPFSARTRARAVHAVAALAVLFFAKSSFADPDPAYTFVKIADTETAAPDGEGNFLSFGAVALDEQGNFAFRGSDALGSRVYVGPIDDPAQMYPRYSVGDPAPGGGGMYFIDIREVTVSHGAVAFRGLRLDHVHGIYTDMSGPLECVADTNTPIPGGSGTFEAFGTGWLWEGVLVFRGLGSDGQDGIYSYDGSQLEVVADTNTTIPLTSATFASFGSRPELPSFYDALDGVPSVANGMVAFAGSGGSRRGVYVRMAGAIHRIADNTTWVPDGFGWFSGFDASGMGANTCGAMVAFHGTGWWGQSGIYIWHDGALERAVDRSTPIPGETGTFANMGTQGYSVDRGSITFLGGNQSTQGVYSTLGGTLRRVAGNDDTIGGKTLAALGSYGRSLEGNVLSFHVGSYGAPGENAIFLAFYEE